MEKLKNKVFIIILGILTIFLISILIIFNIQDYQQEENNIRSNLNRMNINKDLISDKKAEIPQIIDDNKDLNSKIFMDNIVYVVTFDENYLITSVTNHSPDNIADENIITIARDIITNNKDKREYIGNLYFEKYSYSFKANNTLVIIDNSHAKDRIMLTLKNSLLIFAILEMIIIYVAIKLTNWIIKPVKDSFDKQKQFIADASHELKTPLAVIVASSDALEKEPKEKKWLNNIKEEADRMSNLITDLLNMAKSENTEKMQYENVNLSKVVEKSLITFESLMFEKNIKLDYEIEENINFMCNTSQMKQLVGILIDNAIKYSDKEGEIYFTLKKEKNNITLIVKNKGEEISKEDQERIFERFYRADASRNRNENRYGLGLAIAKNIVENHGGKISVNSSNGYNSFIINFK